MGVTSKSERQINFYYYPGHKLAKDCLAYAASSDAILNAINIEKTKITGTQWVELAEKLGKNVTDLLETEHPVYAELYGKDSRVSQEDAIKILQNHPEVLIYPIAVRGDKAIYAKMMTDILKLTKSDLENALEE
ncbi:MAG: hypothetical protein COZ75_03895 [Flavobacteriaceae bacterium CG_4_8_14_3_um_filter_34_10]|nr:hypothetical protein [Flavobacteriia bacterium]OIP52277.1 MAG: hypothetical protein AUK33_01285 [Flavobacteriaceae bacterium CG2_30_34_30]PIQ17732.1 MAG: hypothetical protein COW66_09860 [Flavobacteriaceae bacterium CG18_big_fil_WC_8_21_14_2_50_34_36]PIV51462.1 MAG: hypothetical protein COS19_01130 [Flavobacteriaceae bacterium CG02_land_8_20_14_3_00_34_13]PIX09965.1 MAG: hypothetical protein COZ75_03895 [Flavobacteriaceae bacterium CG_4_8_14_3_um_filter_34_10]PIZ07748.1 MAG: hypothetical pr